MFNGNVQYKSIHDPEGILWGSKWTQSINKESDGNVPMMKMGTVSPCFSIIDVLCKKMMFFNYFLIEYDDVLIIFNPNLIYFNYNLMKFDVFWLPISSFRAKSFCINWENLGFCIILDSFSSRDMKTIPCLWCSFNNWSEISREKSNSNQYLINL